MSRMLGLPHGHAECLTLTIGVFLAVRSIVLASQAEQKTIPLQPVLSEVVHECLSTEVELARRLEAAEAALAAKDAELAAERAVAREAVAQAVAAREATVRAQAARASAEEDARWMPFFFFSSTWRWAAERTLARVASTNSLRARSRSPDASTCANSVT